MLHCKCSLQYSIEYQAFKVFRSKCTHCSGRTGDNGQQTTDMCRNKTENVIMVNITHEMNIVAWVSRVHEATNPTYTFLFAVSPFSSYLFSLLIFRFRSLFSIHAEHHRRYFLHLNSNLFTFYHYRIYANDVCIISKNRIHTSQNDMRSVEWGAYLQCCNLNDFHWTIFFCSLSLSVSICG